VLKVRIRNFQSITDTSFDIDGFTVIVGKNNKGKSATIRAIDAALSNKLGNNFIKWGQTETQVNIQRDNLDIAWVKGDAASYKVNGKPYTSLKGAVPQPILDAGFRKLEIADEKLNPITAHQFDEIFLLDRSGPFITETISTLYDLNTLNDADTLCQKKLKASKSGLKTRQGDLGTLTEKIEKFRGLGEVKTQFETIKKLQEKSDNLKKEIDEIEKLTTQLSTLTKTVGSLKEIKNIKIPEIEKTTRIIVDYQWVTSALFQYNNLNTNVKKLEAIRLIKVKDLSGTEKVIIENQWLINTDKNFQALVKQVNSFKNITNIKLPDLKKTETLLEGVIDLLSLTGRLKEIAVSCNRYSKGLIDVNNLKTLSERIKNNEDQVEGFSFITEAINSRRDLSQNVKNLDCDLSEAKNNLSKAQEEFNKFENCPLCSSPLSQAHSHE